MSVGVTGDIGELHKICQAFKALGQDATLRAISKSMSEETLYLVHWGFDNEMDPYGDPWEPLVYRDGQILQKTGRLANSFHRSYAAGGYEVYTNVEYAMPHQDGAEIHRKAGTLKHGANGRFMSNKRAGAADEKWGEETPASLAAFARGESASSKAVGSKLKKVNVSFHGSYDIHLPRRMMVPDGYLPPRWEKGLMTEAMRVIDKKLDSIGG